MIEQVEKMLVILKLKWLHIGMYGSFEMLAVFEQAEFYERKLKFSEIRIYSNLEIFEYNEV